MVGTNDTDPASRESGRLCFQTVGRRRAVPRRDTGLWRDRRYGKTDRMTERIESGGMVVVRWHQPQNSQSLQNLGHSRLHSHQNEMLMMGLSHVDHVLNGESGSPVDDRHGREIQHDNGKAAPSRDTLKAADHILG